MVQRLTLKCDGPLSKFAFDCNLLRHYSTGHSVMVATDASLTVPNFPAFNARDAVPTLPVVVFGKAYIWA